MQRPLHHQQGVQKSKILNVTLRSDCFYYSRDSHKYGSRCVSFIGPNKVKFLGALVKSLSELKVIMFSSKIQENTHDVLCKGN